MATFRQFSRTFTPKINEILDDVLDGGRGNFLGKLAEDLKDKIVFRSRRGFGVRNTGEGLYRFPRFSAQYLEQRKDARRDGILSSRTSVRRSNITYTGQMLDSVAARTNGRGRIELYLDNNEAEFKAFQLHNNRRPFFFLSRSEVNFVRTEIDRELEKQIKQEF